MNREEAKQLLSIIQAFAEGKTVQWFCPKLPGDTWEDIEEPDFDTSCGALKYRIKPEPKLRPWTKSECPKIFIARRKGGGEPVVMSWCPPGLASIAWFFESGRAFYMLPEDLLENYDRIAEDGTEHPCGIIE